MYTQTNLGRNFKKLHSGLGYTWTCTNTSTPIKRLVFEQAVKHNAVTTLNQQRLLSLVLSGIILKERTQFYVTGIPSKENPSCDVQWIQISTALYMNVFLK